MQELKIETKYHHPAFAAIMHGLAGTFQKLDKELADTMHQAKVDCQNARDEAMRDCLKVIYRDADQDFDSLCAIVEEGGIHLLTELMEVNSWETVEEPCGGHGDSISYSSSKIPESYDFEEAWVEWVFNRLSDEQTEKINTFFEEKGE